MSHRILFTKGLFSALQSNDANNLASWIIILASLLRENEQHDRYTLVITSGLGHSSKWVPHLITAARGRRDRASRRPRATMVSPA